MRAHVNQADRPTATPPAVRRLVNGPIGPPTTG